MKPNDETHEIVGKSFLNAALAHALVTQKEADRALEHAKQHNIDLVDAVLALSIMEPDKVEVAQMLCAPKEFVPGYELLGLIGWGASGNIFRAKQTGLQREVAVKAIKRNAPETLQSRMQREAEAIARLQHPNIVVPYESGFAKGRFYIVMELVEGGTLYDYIQRESPTSDLVTWQIIRQAAAALSHAHEAGIVHRDVKPSNILLAPRPVGSSLPSSVPFAKVADFGLAQDLRDQTDVKITAAGVALGTPAYVAPEQLEDTDVDCRADIYALGATAFHLLSGKMPCADQSPIRAIMEKSAGNDSWREQLPDFVSGSSAKLFRDMTESNPEHRVADYEELIFRIDQLLVSNDETLSLTRAWQSNSMTKSRKSVTPWPRFAIGILAIGVLLSLMLFSQTAIWRDSRDGKQDSQIAEPAASKREWRPIGVPQPLFNGTSVPVALVNGGNWIPAESASDRSLVLRGKEKSSLRIPLSRSGSPTNNVRLRCSVATEADSAVVDVEFETIGGTESTEEPAPRIRITHREVQVFVDGMFLPLEPPLLFPNVNESSNQPFRRMQCDRKRNSLTVYVNGKIVTQWSISSAAEVTTVIRCTKGDAELADIDIVDIAEVPQATGAQ